MESLRLRLAIDAALSSARYGTHGAESLGFGAQGDVEATASVAQSAKVADRASTRRTRTDRGFTVQV